MPSSLAWVVRGTAVAAALVQAEPPPPDDSDWHCLATYLGNESAVWSCVRPHLAPTVQPHFVPLRCSAPSRTQGLAPGGAALARPVGAKQVRPDASDRERQAWDAALQEAQLLRSALVRSGLVKRQEEESYLKQEARLLQKALLRSGVLENRPLLGAWVKKKLSLLASEADDEAAATEGGRLGAALRLQEDRISDMREAQRRAVSRLEGGAERRLASLGAEAGTVEAPPLEAPAPEAPSKEVELSSPEVEVEEPEFEEPEFEELSLEELEALGELATEVSPQIPPPKAPSPAEPEEEGGLRAAVPFLAALAALRAAGSRRSRRPAESRAAKRAQALERANEACGARERGEDAREAAAALDREVEIAFALEALAAKRAAEAREVPAGLVRARKAEIEARAAEIEARAAACSPREPNPEVGGATGGPGAKAARPPRSSSAACLGARAPAAPEGARKTQRPSSASPAPKRPLAGARAALQARRQAYQLKPAAETVKAPGRLRLAGFACTEGGALEVPSEAGILFYPSQAEGPEDSPARQSPRKARQSPPSSPAKGASPAKSSASMEEVSDLLDVMLAGARTAQAEAEGAARCMADCCEEVGWQASAWADETTTAASGATDEAGEALLQAEGQLQTMGAELDHLRRRCAAAEQACAAAEEVVLTAHEVVESAPTLVSAAWLSLAAQLSSAAHARRGKALGSSPDRLRAAAERPATPPCAVREPKDQADGEPQEEAPADAAAGPSSHIEQQAIPRPLPAALPAEACGKWAPEDAPAAVTCDADAAVPSTPPSGGTVMLGPGQLRKRRSRRGGGYGLGGA